MSGKSQTVWEFTVSRPSQILPTKLEIVDIPDRLGWTGTNLGNPERCYFPDASQISAMVGDHSRQMKTQICTDGDVGVRRRWISLITNPLNCWAPVPLSRINMASLENTSEIEKIWDRPLANVRYIGKIWDGRQKVKSPIVWDFPDIWKPGLIETLPILQICPRSSRTIGDIYDFEFSLVGKIWDGRETVKSQTVWDFPDIWKSGFNKIEVTGFDMNT